MAASTCEIGGRAASHEPWAVRSGAEPRSAPVDHGWREAEIAFRRGQALDRRAIDRPCDFRINGNGVSQLAVCDLATSRQRDDVGDWHAVKLLPFFSMNIRGASEIRRRKPGRRR
jgi:hypothetical protein